MIRGIVALSMLLAVGLLFALAGMVLAAEVGPSVVDPDSIDFAILLTAGGVPIAGAIVASIIQVAKRLPGVTGNESAISIVIAAALIGVAFNTTGAELNVKTGFLTFLAWINLAGFTSAAYDKAPEGLKTALKGS